MAKQKKNSFLVQETPIQFFSHKEEDYISLTDIVKKFGDDAIIYNWMRNRNTLEYIGTWEQFY